MFESMLQAYQQQGNPNSRWYSWGGKEIRPAVTTGRVDVNAGNGQAPVMVAQQAIPAGTVAGTPQAIAAQPTMAASQPLIANTATNQAMGGAVISGIQGVGDALAKGARAQGKNVPPVLTIPEMWEPSLADFSMQPTVGPRANVYA